MKVNIKIILRILSVIGLFTGFIFLIPILVGVLYSEPCTSIFAYTSAATILLSSLLFYYSKSYSNLIGKREGCLIVVSSWVFIGFISSFPYYYINDGLSYASAIFESFSGLTTTGATIFADLEALPKNILIWRSLTQWIGGMGIIVLTVAIFPIIGIGGVELFVAESPGPTSNKLHPRIKETAKRLWLIYVTLTLILTVILRMEGMIWFDAINHGLTTMATGGFSTKNDSIAFFDSALIQYTLVLFMFLAGINYTLIYAGVKGNFRKFWQNDEFKFYTSFVLAAIVVATMIILTNTDQSLELCFRQSCFQVISLVTTTGYISADYTAWSTFGTVFFFLLLFTGACAGSTTGGIKFIRHLVFGKNALLEFKRLLHPNALIRIRINNEIVRPRTITHILVFLLVYLFVFVIGTLIMSIILADVDQPLLSSLGSVATCLGNVGPAIGSYGATDNFFSIPDSGKLVLSLIMLIGRLELFSVMILFTAYFWRGE